jgi:alpha-beta hydrolase superfamily lysophospholipase
MPTELQIPIGDGLHTAVTLVSPAEPDGTLLFAFPGGGYNRRYYDLAIPGGYSQAQWHAARGWTVACCDHLGVGDSSLPDPEALGFDELADANRATVDAVRERLQLSGPVLGAGQSMGGCLLIRQQAKYRSFDAIAVLGFSAFHTVLPMPDGGYDMPEGLPLEEAVTHMTKALTSYAFHFPDEPSWLVAEDVDGYPLRPGGNVPTWASAAVPPAAVSMLEPGIVAEQAAAIDVPVLIVAAEIDVNPDLAAESAAYPNAPSVETMRLDGAAHMHNFANSREVLWQRIHVWGQALGPRD